MNYTAKPDARTQISSLLFAVLLVNKDFVIVEANHAAEDMFGRSEKRLKGLNFAAASGLSELVAKRLSGGESQLVARGVTIAPTGADRLVNVTVSPLVAQPEWRIVTLSDAGQDDMRGESERQSALQAPAILAHEIKNPLAAIKGASQLLARKLPHQDTKLTNMIADEVDRIARLIDRMQELGSSHLDALEPVNLHQAIRRAMASVRTAAAERVELTEEFDPSLPLVAAHADGLEQVLVNLLSNAVDVSDGLADPRVTVRTRFVSGLATKAVGSGHSVRLPIEIAVCDFGPGVDPSLAGHFFEPFVTSKKNGQGLGLALVKKLVTDMGGRVSYKRVTNLNATEFRVHLAVAE